MTLKEQVYAQCRQQLAEKILAREQTLKELADSAANETKSSAGDKYETGRAMLHMEQDNVRRAMADLMAQKTALALIDPALHPERIGRGSLVKWSGGYYFLSIALGKITVAGRNIVALSPQSPLGSKLMGLKAGDTLRMNETEIVIEAIA